MTATGLEALYPFLYADGGALEALLEAARCSTEAKAAEITELRAELARAHGARLELCARQMAGRFASGGRLLAFGNGGSSTDAQELATLFLHPGGRLPPLPAIALTNDVAVVTALSNDVGFEVAFSRQIAAFARPADVAVGISTSGNSANLLLGLEEAARRGLLTVGIAGYDGGRMAELEFLDHLFTVPSPSVHRVQEAQTTLYHALWELTVAALAPAATPIPAPTGRAETRGSN
ncbi:D-sedoheptulose-7-phosphate isomerase [Actinospica robiniae]|uniref:D-sedoheptulose-7-phosphate isomerase n=1 Tax=Actinospica robiniae TaxID=304901 RepID=UPI00041221CE|nr:SIS domain-containing protein [Actinospica robiniae]